jgi:hypothetical protein
MMTAAWRWMERQLGTAANILPSGFSHELACFTIA